jgi:hypothetical protein
MSLSCSPDSAYKREHADFALARTYGRGDVIAGPDGRWFERPAGTSTGFVIDGRVS